MSNHHHNASTVAAPQLADVVASFSYPELEERKEIIHARLKEITIEEPAPPPKKKAGAKRPRSTTPSNNGTPPATDGTSSGGGTNLVPLPPPKTDTHWDFVMKEMMWLAADFMGERKRQHTFAKKAANGIKQFHKTKETRRVRQLAEAELKRRRLAAKQGRQLRAWWTKIERVIAYKQKLSADGERRKAMNQQLVDLVRTTERYGETLATAQVDDDEKALSIEEALAAADRLRSRNVERRDYSQLRMADEEIYGHSTTSESGSDGSFVVDSNDEDDETTLRQAEVEETRERRRRQPRGSDDDGDSYVADPDEIKKLQEESSMDVDKVLERMKEEAEHIPDVVNDPEDDSSVVSTKKVTFAADVVKKRSRRQKALRRAPSPRHRTASSQADLGHDADDDADASDVEDFVDEADGDGSDEFQADENEVDDETTIAAEERLGRDMSAEDEINLLQQESEVSIEELRMKYAALQDNGAEEECVESEVEDTKLPARDLENAALAAVEEKFKEDDAEDEFQPTNEVDDETTIEAEERLGREMPPDQEISVLEAESQIPIEQLRAMYAQMSKEEEEDDDPNPDEIKIAQPVESMEEDSSYRDLLAKADDVGDDVEEFVPEMMEADDETTMEAEERLGRDMSYEAEIKLLQRESEMSVDELRKLYGAINGGAEESADEQIDELSSAYEGDDGEDEFKPDENAVDDETTLEAEERLGREMSTEAEIALLKRESETPVEELRAMYASLHAKDGDSSDRNDSKRRRVDTNQEGDEQEEDGMVALDVLEASVQRARNTTASRPFLLSSWVKLRKYQQIGLNWLVSIQTRRLNGIL